MRYFSSGSPSFKLFLDDLAPIAKRVGIDIWKSAVTLAITALASPEVRSIVEAHFGTVVGIGFASIVTLVVSGRFVKDNTQG